ncbi:hypothetical protein HAX54_034667 [Datura stramonium]|uniref:Uncharacterized protein n=1 Tax=Datura stramonium TaxID=4076 RepID=A0ABS8VHX8_DATST|nr:hypothetical protein [Datura stramonium]
MQAKVEANAYNDTYTGEGFGNSNSDSSNESYELDEMGDSRDDSDNDLQPTDDVSQNKLFHRKNIPFLYYLQDHPDVCASTCESEGVACNIWLDNKESDLESG